MYDRLEKIDPEYAATITKHDKVKIIRALEIITLTHSKVSSLSWNKRQQTVNFNFQCWFLFRARETIYQRIEERCDYMLKNGLLDEVIALKKGGLLKNKSASSAIGYRQCLEYLMTSQADQDFEILRSEFKKATRHYAKRQFTWFRKEPEFKWLDLDIHDKEIAVNIIATDYYRQEP